MTETEPLEFGSEPPAQAERRHLVTRRMVSTLRKYGFPVRVSLDLCHAAGFPTMHPGRGIFPAKYPHLELTLSPPPDSALESAYRSIEEAPSEPEWWLFRMLSDKGLRPLQVQVKITCWHFEEAFVANNPRLMSIMRLCRSQSREDFNDSRNTDLRDGMGMYDLADSGYFLPSGSAASHRRAGPVRGIDPNEA